MKHYPATVAHARLVVLASVGLPRMLPPDPWHPSPAEWDDVAHAARSQRIWGLVRQAMLAGWISPPTDEAAAQVAGAHQSQMVWSMTVDAATIAVAEAFADHGIRFRLLKGSAHAHVLYPDPSWRGYSDIDVLVMSDQLGDAVDVITQMGGRRHHHDADAMVVRYGKGIALTLPGGVEVDLHRRLGGGVHQYTDSDALLFDRPGVVALGPCQVPVLPVDLMAVNAALHAVVAGDARRLVPLRDLAGCTAHPDFDPERARCVATDVGAAGPLAVAVGVCRDWFDLRVPDDLATWCEEYRSTRTEREWMDSYGPDQARGVALLAAARSLPSVAAQRRYLWDVARTHTPISLVKRALAYRRPVESRDVEAPAAARAPYIQSA